MANWGQVVGAGEPVTGAGAVLIVAVAAGVGVDSLAVDEPQADSPAAATAASASVIQVLVVVFMVASSLPVFTTTVALDGSAPPQGKHLTSRVACRGRPCRGEQQDEKRQMYTHRRRSVVERMIPGL